LSSEKQRKNKRLRKEKERRIMELLALKQKLIDARKRQMSKEKPMTPEEKMQMLHQQAEKYKAELKKKELEAAEKKKKNQEVVMLKKRRHHEEAERGKIEERKVATQKDDENKLKKIKQPKASQEARKREEKK